MTTETDPTIVAQLAEFARLKTPELVARFTELFGEAPRCKNIVWLRRNVSWKIQELHHGGLSPAARERLEKLIDEAVVPGIDAPTADTPRTRDPSEPPVGTTLVREWHGQQIRVAVRDNGYEWNGATYRSLSAVARAITNVRWNGRLFFNLAPARTRR